MNNEIKELSSLSTEDLLQKLEFYKKSLVNLRCNLPPKDTSIFSKHRKSVARIKTLIKLKSNR